MNHDYTIFWTVAGGTHIALVSYDDFLEGNNVGPAPDQYLEFNEYVAGAGVARAVYNPENIVGFRQWIEADTVITEDEALAIRASL